MAVGKGRKSAGNITFRTVRGRTIMSEKVGPRDVSTRGETLSIYERNFKYISMYIGAHRKDINVSFDKTKFGSQGNYFYKLNKTALEAALLELTGLTDSATMVQVENAITEYATANPAAIYRVKRSGYESKYLTGEWKSSDNPVEPEPEAVVTATIGNISRVLRKSAVQEGGTNISVSDGDVIKIAGKGIGSTATNIKIFTGKTLVTTLDNFSAKSDEISGTVGSDVSLATNIDNIQIVGVSDYWLL